MKYIDADRFLAEIRKRLKNTRDYMNGSGMKYKGPKYFRAQGKESAYDALFSVITSLQQEQPEVDLEKEMDKWLDAEPHTVRDTARHFYELGLKARKEE